MVSPIIPLDSPLFADIPLLISESTDTSPIPSAFGLGRHPATRRSGSAAADPQRQSQSQAGATRAAGTTGSSADATERLLTTELMTALSLSDSQDPESSLGQIERLIALFSVLRSANVGQVAQAVLLLSDTLLSPRTPSGSESVHLREGTAHTLTDVVVGMRVRVSPRAKQATFQALDYLGRNLMPWLPDMDAILGTVGVIRMLDAISATALVEFHDAELSTRSSWWLPIHHLLKLPRVARMDAAMTLGGSDARHIVLLRLLEHGELVRATLARQAMQSLTAVLRPQLNPSHAEMNAASYSLADCGLVQSLYRAFVAPWLGRMCLDAFLHAAGNAPRLWQKWRHPQGANGLRLLVPWSQCIAHAFGDNIFILQHVFELALDLMKSASRVLTSSVGSLDAVSTGAVQV
jgi:hypothetical protein